MKEKTPSDAPFLTLVVPSYNEEKRIAAGIKDIQSFFNTWPISLEVILVIEKSTDRTVEIAKQTVGNDPRFVILANDVQKGKGYAVKCGMLKARGDFVFFMDVDLSTPLVEVMSFLGHFEASPKTDIIIGSRQHPKSQILKKQNPLRRKMGQIFNLCVQTLTIKGITDTQCGFKAFRKKCVTPIFSRQKINGFSFDVEILMIAKKLGYKIDILPVRWINSADSKVRVVRDSAKMLMDLFRMKLLVRRTLKQLPPSSREE